MTDVMGQMIPLVDRSSQLVIGETFLNFLTECVRADSRDRVRDSAIEVLSDALAMSHANAAGLVVGRVQSGKTLNYESVIALARDNGFSLVVVITGTSNALLNQGVDRLRTDLRKADPNAWDFIKNPDLNSRPYMANALAQWTEEGISPEFRSTLVAVLLKNVVHIENFAAVCKDLIDSRHRVLVIDDEADQASLNAAAKKGEETPTYSQIRQLRENLGTHIYLQYTATPQAPLLVELIDGLSPDFVRVIEPGDDYVGGPVFFAPQSRYVREIPEADVQLVGREYVPAPSSLRQAFQTFLIAFLHGRLKLDQRVSMLIHPSRTVDPHQQFARWVQGMCEDWLETMRDGTPQEKDLLLQEFREQHQDLSATEPGIVDFGTVANNLVAVLLKVVVTAMNNRSGTPEVDWDRDVAHVLVGGQMLDRGYTVVGLAVTYMPRGSGMGIADTIQQRARFFGYKKKYLGICRVFLEPEIRGVFEEYVKHEEALLEDLREMQGRPGVLKQWPREFLLDPKMKPTRDAVAVLKLASEFPANSWIHDDTAPDQDEGDFESIAEVIVGLREKYDSAELYNHVSIRLTLEQLLAVTQDLAGRFESETSRSRALQLQLARLRDRRPDLPAQLLFMRPGETTRRTVTQAGKVQPFQGKSPDKSSGGYPGDRELHKIDGNDVITVQLHRFAVTRREEEDPYAIAVRQAWWIPGELADGWRIETR